MSTLAEYSFFSLESRHGSKSKSCLMAALCSKFANLEFEKNFFLGLAVLRSLLCNIVLKELGGIFLLLLLSKIIWIINVAPLTIITFREWPQNLKQGVNFLNKAMYLFEQLIVIIQEHTSFDRRPWIINETYFFQQFSQRALEFIWRDQSQHWRWKGKVSYYSFFSMSGFAY